MSALLLKGVIFCGLDFQLRQVDPAALGPRLQAGFGQLHALGRGQQAPGELGKLADHMPQEQLPLGPEPVRVVLRVGDLFPTLKEVDRLRRVGVPNWLGRIHPALRPALRQAGHCAAMRAIHVEGDEVVAADPGGPGGVDLRDDPALQLERRVGRVVGVGLVGVALLVVAHRDVCGAEAGHGLRFAEEVVEQVAPVAEDIEDNAAAVGFLVVPGRALGRLQVTFEHPIAEFAAHREQLAEEAAVDGHLELPEAGQEQLVLHGAVSHTGLLGETRQVQRILKVIGGRLLAVDRHWRHADGPLRPTAVRAVEGQPGDQALLPVAAPDIQPPSVQPQQLAAPIDALASLPDQPLRSDEYAVRRD